MLRRLSRTALATIALGALLGLAAGVVCARPAAFFGTDGRTLADSVEDEVGAGFREPSCTRAGDAWRCHVSITSEGALDYRVRVDSRGCWSARPLEAEGGYVGTRRPSGCIGVMDYVRPWERVFGY
jgi:hypothetical protein